VEAHRSWETSWIHGLTDSGGCQPYASAALYPPRTINETILQYNSVCSSPSPYTDLQSKQEPCVAERRCFSDRPLFGLSWLIDYSVWLSPGLSTITLSSRLIGRGATTCLDCGNNVPFTELNRRPWSAARSTCLPKLCHTSKLTSRLVSSGGNSVDRSFRAERQTAPVLLWLPFCALNAPYLP
jgi:hypothetical protein